MALPSFFSYLITDRRYYTDTPAVFRANVHAALAKHLPAFALYREPHNPDYAVLAEHFLETCARFPDTKGLLHRDIALAVKLGAFGVHLTSKQPDEIASAKAAGLFTVVSTHTLEEIRHAETEGADAVTYSPIFETPGKGVPKGLEDLNETAGKINLPVIALGGIVTPAQVDAVKAAGAAGFASIRYFFEPFQN